MSRQRLIDTCFWDDNYILTLDPSEKLLFLYLLTNPLTMLCGVYEISLKRMAFDTGFDQDTVQRMLQRFEREERCVYWHGWIAMRNWIKHQNQGSPTVQKGIEVQLEKVPPELAEYVRGEGTNTLSYLNLNLNLNLNSNLDKSADAKTPAQSTKPKLPPDPRIKTLIDYYHDAFVRVRGFAPKVNGGTWGKIFKGLLRDSSADTIKAVIDEFFAYDKRTRHGIHDFDRSYDNVYGRLFDQQHPGRQRHAT